MKRLLLVSLLIMLALTWAFAAGQPEGRANELTIWSAAADDEAQALSEAFRRIHPEINVSIIRAGSGELLTRLRAEQPRPQGDILMGIAKEAFDDNIDLFRGYRTANYDSIPEDVREARDQPRYYGFSMPLQAFIVNTQLLSEQDIPRSWAALTDERYQGEIILANPALSGSAYAQLYMMYNLFGDDYLRAISQRAVFVASSTAVPESVARGEYAIGITGEGNIARYIEEGAPVIAVYPEEGTGLRFDASGIIAGGPNPQSAELFMDFLTSRDAYEIIRTTRSRRVVLRDMPGPGPLPGLDEIRFFEYDAMRAASMREELTNRFSDMIE
ncbi:MAG: extracellular solute-binding protein [Spirochaetaceae bacterium]|nr:MAG: extracellular solute-binding protein [Spirochaetaceae bacterium]